METASLIHPSSSRFLCKKCGLSSCVTHYIPIDDSCFSCHIDRIFALISNPKKMPNIQKMASNPDFKSPVI
jgi:hypothetical protein